jgi:uncharacterized protein
MPIATELPLCRLAAVLAALLTAAPAFAQAPPSTAASQSSSRIVVTGEGSVSAPPDYAQIRGGVSTRAKTAHEATDANSKAMTAVIAALTDAGIAQKDIQTAQFTVQPVYPPAQPNTEPKLIGFSASNTVMVKIRQLDKLGDILDRLTAAGATDVGGIEFLHSDLSKALDQAREAAVADARRKAELYAHAAGASLGPVAWISEDAGYAPMGPMQAMRQRAAAAPVPILTGEDELQVRITVGFEIGH